MSFYRWVFPISQGGYEFALVKLEEAQKFLENFFRLSLTIILSDSGLIWKASEIKAEYAISYADCFAAATALRTVFYAFPLYPLTLLLEPFVP